MGLMVRQCIASLVLLAVLSTTDAEVAPAGKTGGDIPYDLYKEGAGGRTCDECRAVADPGGNNAPYMGSSMKQAE